MKNTEKQKTPSLVVIAGLTTLTALFWVAISIYMSIRKTEEIDIPKNVIKPVNPTLDREALSHLNDRFYVEKESLPDTLVKKTEEDSDTVEPTPTPTDENLKAKLEEENTATQSAEGE